MLQGVVVTTVFDHSLGVAFPKRELLESSSMTSRLAIPFLAAAVGLFALSACGGSSTPSGTAPPEADVVVKALDGISWNSKSYAATATDGEVVIFGANDSSIAHNLYVVDSSDKVIGDFIDLPKRGSSGARQLELAPGTYRIVCKIPGHNNMNSTLTVN